MLNRILEPEVMDTVAEAVDYNSMDHSTVNRIFVDDFLSAIGSKPDGEPLQIFDAGTGTALIPIELLSRKIPVMITASDLAEQMLIVAAENVKASGCDQSIRLVRSDCKQLPDATEIYDAVISNSIIHHIPEPRLVLGEMWRILKPGGLLFVRDLMRPTDLTTLEWLVETYAGPANPHQKQMFRDSLHAALTVAEVAEMMRELRIPQDSVRATSDRHWTICIQKHFAQNKS